jgi:uncharacterized protein (TIGR02996 family)
MNSGESLHAAILEHPNDVQLRQVYADWCEENGRQERAALIHLQCERETLPDWDSRAIEIDSLLTDLGVCLWDEGFDDRRVFETVLTDLPREVDCTALAQIWARSSSGLISKLYNIRRLQRGFAEYFRIEDEDCPAALEQLPALTPVTGIRLRGRVGASAEMIRHLPPQLRRLEVAPYWPRAADFTGLRTETLPASLTELSLEPPFPISQARFRALSAALGALLERPWDSLYLTGPLGERLRSHFARWQRSVRHLGLGPPLGDGYERMFAGPWAGQLEGLRLHSYDQNHQMTPAGLSRLLAALASLPRLRSLDMEYFECTNAAWLAFVDAGGLGQVEDVSLGRTDKIGLAWLQHLARSGQPTALRRLVLHDCGFGDTHLRWLLRGAHPHLVWLDLAHIHSPNEGLSRAGAAALARSTLRSQLRWLDLTNHSLGDDGLRALAKVEWPELRHFTVNCVATQDGVADFLRCFQARNLLRLAITCQGPADRLAIALGEMAPSASPFKLFLHAQFREDDIPALLRSRYLMHLRQFQFAFTAVSDPGKQRLREHFGARLILH